ncbi:hypothetical protein NE237_003917 [Protea cynaroides]|uniref:Uncharacterized protein n=1 Tax=Protea cynaroides TaxID=273540 RepID=A0A9Q0KHM9_9MAGN|nr:hypothetical protein NE237_003917 [Protea cynaroides]
MLRLVDLAPSVGVGEMELIPQLNYPLDGNDIVHCFWKLGFVDFLATTSSYVPKDNWPPSFSRKSMALTSLIKAPLTKLAYPSGSFCLEDEAAISKEDSSGSSDGGRGEEVGQ